MWAPAAILPLITLFLVSCEGRQPADPPSPIARQTLPFRIVEETHQKKTVRYVLIIVDAVLTEARADLTKASVEATLWQLLLQSKQNYTRRGERQPSVDGITARLWESVDHMRGGQSSLGIAEWWPKGHTFDPNNAANIENKATHVERVSLGTLPSVPDVIVDRLPEAARREIFTANVLSQDRARREADKLYPIDWSASSTAMAQNHREQKQRREKYEAQLLHRYQISKSELETINTEALMRRWPFPPVQ